MARKGTIRIRLAGNRASGWPRSWPGRAQPSSSTTGTVPPSNRSPAAISRRPSSVTGAKGSWRCSALRRAGAATQRLDSRTGHVYNLCYGSGRRRSNPSAVLYGLRSGTSETLQAEAPSPARRIGFGGRKRICAHKRIELLYDVSYFEIRTCVEIPWVKNRLCELAGSQQCHVPSVPKRTRRTSEGVYLPLPRIRIGLV